MPVSENMIPMESKEQNAAFRYWYGLGNFRSYKKVGDRFEKHHKTIQNWHDKFNWEERRVRLEESEERAKGNVMEESDPSAVGCAKRIEGLIGEILDDPEAVREIKENIKKPSDLMNLAKLAAFLQGKNFDSGDGDGGEDNSLASRAAMKILEEHGLGKGKD